MKFTKDADINGTSLKGYVITDYATLVEVFGQPDERNGDKTTVAWFLQFEDGTIATIYDWKTYETPFGRYDWHVGGKSHLAVSHVHDAIATHKEKTYA